MDERILDLLAALASIQRELGPAVYDDAVERARLGAAVAVHIEAERVALRHARRHPEGNVVRLPSRDPSRPPRRGGSDGSF